MRGVYLLVGERLHRVSERVVWAPLRPRTDAGLQSKTWRLLLDRDSIEELSKGRSARYTLILFIKKKNSSNVVHKQVAHLSVSTTSDLDTEQ